MNKPFPHILIPLLLGMLPFAHVNGQVSPSSFEYIQQKHQIHLTPLHEAKVRQYHEETIYFYVPDDYLTLSSFISGLKEDEWVTSIALSDVCNLPLGFNWTLLKDHHGEGQLKLSGTPIQAGYHILDLIFEVKTLSNTYYIKENVDLIIRPETYSKTLKASPITGCGNLEVFLETKHKNPSPGIRHFWNFGDGTSSQSSNPKSHFYNKPGTYTIDYRLEVDTFGLLLNRLTLNSLACPDKNGSFLTWDSKPDIYFIIKKNVSGEIVFQSNNVYHNASFPLDIYPQLKMENQSYQLEVWDKNGRKDELCSVITFNEDSPDQININGAQIEMEFIHPIQTYKEQIQVIVSPELKPPLLIYNDASFCENAQLEINASSSHSIQWIKDGIPISNAQDSTLFVHEAGMYEAVVFNDQGCLSYSEPIFIQEDPLPPAPSLKQENNLLSIDGKTLPTGEYSYRWFYNDALIDYEQSPSLCIEQSGYYTIEITNQETGCYNSANYSVTYDPNFNCNIPISDLVLINESLHVFPSFKKGNYCVNFNLNQSKNIRITITDLDGSIVFSEQLNAFEGSYFKVVDIPKTKTKNTFYNLELLVDKSSIKRSLLLP